MTRRLLANQLCSGLFQFKSRWPTCRKIRNGLTAVAGRRSGYGLPPGICTKLDRKPITRRNLSGRNHAAVKAQFPPLLPPQIPQSSGSSEIAYLLVTSGIISVRRNVA